MVVDEEEGDDEVDEAEEEEDEWMDGLPVWVMATAGLRVRSEGAGKTGAAVTVPYRQNVDWEVVP